MGLIFFFQALNSITYSKDLIVYYANETSPEGDEQKNYDQIVRWLQEFKTEKSLRIIEQLKADQIRFPETIQKELADLCKAKAEVYIFTNKLARKNEFALCGLEPYRETKFSGLIPESQNPVLEANPLSNPETLESILAWISEQTSRSSISHVGLILRSHGNREMALTSRIAVWASEITKERFRELIDMPEGTSREKRPGIPREEFFSILENFQKNLQIPVDFVVLESCGAPQGIEAYRIGWAIKSLFLNSSEKVDSYNIDYKVVSNKNTSAVSALYEHLKANPKFKEYKALSFFEKILKSWMYFLPLFLVSLYWIFRRSLKSR